MKHLLQLLLIVMVAVVLTVFAQGNDGRVLLSISTKRIELSLNLAIVLLFVGFFLLHYSLLAFRFSVQLSSRFKYFFSNRKQKALLQANTNALIAWVTEDNQESHRALQQAIASGAETDLSYFIRAAFCLQYHLLDEAEQLLSERSVAQEEPYALAARVLWVKVHLEKHNYVKAWAVLQDMDMHMSALPLIRKLRLLTLVGLEQWTEALGLVEGGLVAYPDDMRLVDCAAKVFSQERLYGKAIVQCERLYAHRPTADVALQLSELHRLAGQADLAEQWKNKWAI